MTVVVLNGIVSRRNCYKKITGGIDFKTAESITPPCRVRVYNCTAWTFLSVRKCTIMQFLGEATRASSWCWSESGCSALVVVLDSCSDMFGNLFSEIRQPDHSGVEKRHAGHAMAKFQTGF